MEASFLSSSETFRIQSTQQVLQITNLQIFAHRENFPAPNANKLFFSDPIYEFYNINFMHFPECFNPFR